MSTPDTTALPDDSAIAIGIGGFRPYRLTVARNERLTPHFTRLTLTGPDLAVFGTDRLDQRIKLVLPLPDGRWRELGLDDPEAIHTGAWYERWRALEPDQQHPIRTYTVRGIDPAARELVVDVVLHEPAGPAGRFGAQAQPGDEIIVVGPDARSEHSAIGIDFHRGTTRNLLLAGDETAAPAICAILEQLAEIGGQWRIHAFVEVPTSADALTVELPAGTALHWLPRGDRAHGEALIEAVTAFTAVDSEFVALGALPAEREPQQLEDVDIDHDLLWEAPEQVVGGAFYAWIAGESGVVKQLRRHLVRDHGVDRGRVAFMGYWRQGRAEN